MNQHQFSAFKNLVYITAGLVVATFVLMPKRLALSSVSGKSIDSSQQQRLSAATAEIAANSQSVVTYTNTQAAFLNPERGFHNDIDLLGADNFSYVRKQGYSLARAYIRLDEYRNRPLPAALLTKLDHQFQLVRQAGIKVIPRFTYNFPKGEAKGLDNSLDRTIAHINQLKPVLQQNADVIAVLQAGFIGSWGEWHNSSNGLDRPEPKAKILRSLLTALPTSRMVQIRYPNDIKTNYPQPLTLTSAFRGDARSRIAFHNDCFLANQSDAGTYEPDLQATKNYTSQIAPYIAVGGETCDVTPAQHRSDCATAEPELAKFHWSYLNPQFYEPIISQWRREGCYEQIDRRLGYRLQLLRSDFPAKIPLSRLVKGNFVIKNVGYASPFNPRGLELILRHRQTGKVYRLPLLKPFSKTHDPRYWLPQLGAIYVTASGKLPSTAPSGSYELLLNLPDPMPKLAYRPEYAIRLANEQIWEAQTGFNSLRRTIQLTK